MSQRLQQIRSLQRLGLPLSDIGDCVADEGFDARQLIGDHLAKVEEQRAALEQLAAGSRRSSSPI